VFPRVWKKILLLFYFFIIIITSLTITTRLSCKIASYTEHLLYVDCCRRWLDNLTWLDNVATGPHQSGVGRFTVYWDQLTELSTVLEGRMVGLGRCRRHRQTRADVMDVGTSYRSVADCIDLFRLARPPTQQDECMSSSPRGTPSIV